MIAAQQKSDPIPGLILLGILITIVIWRVTPLKNVSLRQCFARCRRSPVFVLMFLAPFCAEGITGAAPFFFVVPWLLAYFMLFYGSGAILIREVTLAWGKGWPTQLALGVGYAILEEGLATKVFFEPDRTDLGPWMQYGTLGGVHWPFTIYLLFFHAAFAIMIPIFLTQVMFPGHATRSWVPSRHLFWYGLALTACVVFSALVLHPYNPSAVHYAVTIGLVGALIALGRVLPADIGKRSRERRPLVFTPKNMAIVGFALATSFWITSLGSQGLGVNAAATVVTQLIFLAIAARVLHRISSDTYGWFSLCAGMIGFFIFTSFAVVFLGFFPQMFVGASTWYLLVRFGRQLRQFPHQWPRPGQ